jgi:hypothetical protein
MGKKFHAEVNIELESKSSRLGKKTNKTVRIFKILMGELFLICKSLERRVNVDHHYLNWSRLSPTLEKYWKL